MEKNLIFKCIKCDREIDMTICSNCGKGKYVGKSYMTTEMRNEIAFECPICKNKWNYINCSCGAYNSPEIIKNKLLKTDILVKVAMLQHMYLKMKMIVGLKLSKILEIIFVLNFLWEDIL